MNTDTSTITASNAASVCEDAPATGRLLQPEVSPPSDPQAATPEPSTIDRPPREKSAENLPMVVLKIVTYGDEAYNLTKLSMPEYINDKRFHVHGIEEANVVQLPYR